MIPDIQPHRKVCPTDGEPNLRLSRLSAVVLPPGPMSSKYAAALTDIPK